MAVKRREAPDDQSQSCKKKISGRPGFGGFSAGIKLGVENGKLLAETVDFGYANMNP